MRGRFENVFRSTPGWKALVDGLAIFSPLTLSFSEAEAVLDVITIGSRSRGNRLSTLCLALARAGKRSWRDRATDRRVWTNFKILERLAATNHAGRVAPPSGLRGSIHFSGWAAAPG